MGNDELTVEQLDHAVAGVGIEMGQQEFNKIDQIPTEEQQLADMSEEEFNEFLNQQSDGLGSILGVVGDSSEFIQDDEIEMPRARGR